MTTRYIITDGDDTVRHWDGEPVTFASVAEAEQYIRDRATDRPKFLSKRARVQPTN